MSRSRCSASGTADVDMNGEPNGSSDDGDADGSEPDESPFPVELQFTAHRGREYVAACRVRKGQLVEQLKADVDAAGMQWLFVR